MKNHRGEGAAGFHRNAPDSEGGGRDASALLSVVSGLLGLISGLVLWSLLLGVEVRRHEPGIWTARVRHVVACGLDYNGPPFADERVLWLTCGGEDSSIQLWPVR